MVWVVRRLGVAPANNFCRRSLARHGLGSRAVPPASRSIPFSSGVSRRDSRLGWVTGRLMSSVRGSGSSCLQLRCVCVGQLILHGSTKYRTVERSDCTVFGSTHLVLLKRLSALKNTLVCLVEALTARRARLCDLY